MCWGSSMIAPSLVTCDNSVEGIVHSPKISLRGKCEKLGECRFPLAAEICKQLFQFFVSWDMAHKIDWQAFGGHV